MLRKRRSSQEVREIIWNALESAARFGEIRKKTKLDGKTISRNLKKMRGIGYDFRTCKYYRSNLSYAPINRINRREARYRCASYGLTIKQFHVTRDSKTQEDNTPYWRRTIPANIEVETLTPLGRKKPDDEIFRSAATYVSHMSLPLMILASIPQRGWMKMPIRSYFRLCVSLKYKIPSFETLWEMMQGVLESESLEMLTDYYEKGRVLREKILGQEALVKPHINPRYMKSRQNREDVLYSISIHPKKQRLVYEGREIVRHTCPTCGSRCDGGAIESPVDLSVKDRDTSESRRQRI
jgi:hypothetical protein